MKFGYSWLSEMFEIIILREPWVKGQRIILTFFSHISS